MVIPELYKYYQQNRKVCTDTRKEIEGSVFFCLKGENFNGNKFAREAVEKGAVLVVVDEEEYGIDERTFLVDDVLKTLQDLANHHRNQIKIPVIGLTGSNGKTTTKELIAAILGTKYKTLYSKGNLNNHIGVPLTLLSLSEDDEIAVIEMGANHPGEINELCHIAEPEYGLITNIGRAHLEGFGGFEGVVEAKSELYKYIRSRNGTLFVNSDNPLLVKLSAKIPRINYGSTTPGNCRGSILETDPFLKLSWESISGKIIIATRLFGAYNFENILAAACIGNFFKVEPEDIVKAIENYEPDNSRSQMIRTGKNVILMDAYNANPTSVMFGIIGFNERNARHKTLILGDMLELGKYSKDEHETILRRIDELNIDQVLLVGEEYATVNNNPLYKNFENVLQVMDYFRDHPVKNSTIYIKGSRGIQLEKLLEVL